MELTTPQNQFTYPAEELIDLIVSNNASSPSDLASWGLVAKAFYIPSRRHLFAKIRIDLTSSRRETYSSNTRRLKGILEILSVNVALREVIHHLVVEYRFFKYPRVERGEDFVFKLKSSDFRDILPLVPALRTLTITHPRGEPWCTYDEALMSALANLRTSCPYLHRLELIGLRNVPIGFILQWTNVVDLKLYHLGVIEGGPTLEQSMPAQPLERLSLRYAACKFPELLQTMEVGQLQYLQISAIPTQILNFPMPMTVQMVSQVWDLLKKCASVLNHLYLEQVFGRGPWIYSLSTISVPSLELLEIDEELRENQESPFSSLACFLTPSRTSVFNIRTIRISLTGFVHEQVVLRGEEAWSVLDSALTSKEYQCLSKVEIRLRFFRNEEGKEQATSSLLKDCSSFLLPLVSSSRSIDLKFSILVRYLNLTFTWDNRSSVVHVKKSAPLKR